MEKTGSNFQIIEKYAKLLKKWEEESSHMKHCMDFNLSTTNIENIELNESDSKIKNKFALSIHPYELC